MASIVLGGLEEVLEMKPCSMIMPNIRQIREGEGFLELTHSLSGVGVVLRVSILSGIRSGTVSGRSLRELTDGLMEEGSAVVVLCWERVYTRDS